MMEDFGAPPASPPLPKRGAYNIDFDAIDGDTNPFASKSKMALGSSPPIASRFAQEYEDGQQPSNSQRTLETNSPPHSAVVEEDAALNNCPTESIEDKPPTQTIPKKKKIVKKPKVQSKFKPPKNFNTDISDDIQIFSPGGDMDNNNQTSKASVTEFPVEAEDEGAPPQDAAAEAMASSCLGPDHRFGEDGDDDIVGDSLAAHPQERRAGSSRDSAESLSKSSENANLSQTSAAARPESPAEGKQTKHPAVRALEVAQSDIGVGPGKIESSSDEGQFFDAYEYPVPSTSETRDKGQASPKIMDRVVAPESHGDQNKGTVVQLVQVLRYSQTDWNKMKQELELNYQASLLNKERDWSHLLADRDKKISTLSDTSKKLKATNEDMRMVVAEFEKTISQLQADKEKNKSESHKTVNDLENERDQAIEDLQSVETAFSDLHRRYEKSKAIIEGFKRNEEQLKSCVEDLQGKVKKSEGKLLSLRSQAEEKLDRASEDIEKMKKATRSEVVRLEAALKKAELRISSLEESLQRKEKENQELTAICDELIAKVGS